MSFCRITGRARNLPKPNFFPIIPPISPADARRLCRITGKRMDDHNYVPLLEVGKRPDCVKCTVTGKAKAEDKKTAVHDLRNDYKYVTPILRKEAMEPCDQKAFEDLQKVLKRLKKGMPESERDKVFVYLLPAVLCGLIIPAEVEEAIRIGEMETLSLSKSCEKAVFKIRGKPTLFIPLKEVDIKTAGGLFDGKGQTKETLAKQKKILEEKKRKTLANKKIFEDLERQGDEELLKDLERPKGQGRIFGGARSKEAKQYRGKVNNFLDMYLPNNNMAFYGPEWTKAIKVQVTSLDWPKIEKVKQIDLDSPLPKKAKLDNLCEPIEQKRRKNVYIPDSHGLEVVPSVEDVAPKDFQWPSGLLSCIQDSKNSLSDFNSCWSLKSMFKEEALKILPSLEEFQRSAENSSLVVKTGCIYDHGDGAKFCEEPSMAPKEANVVVGAILKIRPPKGQPNAKEVMRFFPGLLLEDKKTFAPGQRMASAKGEFIPGACLRSDMGTFQFIPGVIGLESQFMAGQFIEEGNEVDFVKGQVVHSSNGSKFVEGETVVTADGLKFVAGITIKNETGSSFVSGALIDLGGESARFVAGQLITKEEDQLIFIAGHMGEVQGKPVFVPGQFLGNAFVPGQMIDEGQTFLHGEVMVNGKGQVMFMPGIYDDNSDQFWPGIVGEGQEKNSKFIEGKLHNLNNETIFVPGTTTILRDDNRFEKASSIGKITTRSSPEPPAAVIDGRSLSVIFKKTKPKNGVVVITSEGPKFFPEGKIPPELSGCEVLQGRMECGEHGPQFVPGKIMEIHGIRTFIPGKVIIDESGEEIFVPGKMIHGKNGPRFVPGQVIESEDGDEKFIPGQVMDTPDGPKFVPGQVIDTKSGPVFIPGQVIRTDSGLKFVPGQIVETSHGALFVPGQVIDSPEGARFVPGHVVDTQEGPRLLPPDIKGDGNLEYCVQGFDIDQEEARLILGNTKDTSDVADILGGIGGASIGAEALRALAEGFASRKGNAIITIGEGQDVDQLLQDEMLDSCDSPAVRKIVMSIFMTVFAELCQRIDEIILQMQSYIDSCLKCRLDQTLSSDMKLNPAIEALKRFCQEKNTTDPNEYDILNLIAGIITCSVPGALKECCSDEQDLEESRFKSILLSCIEDSIKGILEEDGIISNGLFEDIKELVKLAKDLEFDENQSFFNKVAAVTEGRCNSKFMDTLLKNLKNADGKSGLGTNELLSRLINILAPRLHLQSGFKELTTASPDFVHQVLECLKGDGRDIQGFTAIDILHWAISKVINNRCQSKLDDVVHRVELDGMVLEKDQDIRSMLEQAIGLARFMKKDHVTESLFELLGDPIRLEAIRDDPIIKDVLNKILVMQHLTEKDSKKRQKLEKLQRYTSEDEDDHSLSELIHICEALTRPPHQGNLKKSKSMIKRSKSMIVTAKDIPMNAFMAMKNSAETKDEKWLQNFLSESLVEDIPWECSKALIILKQGFQAIIPREASRSILMGEASYTLIDDTGVEFYLSHKDKQKRKKQGMEGVPKKVTLIEEPVDYYPHYNQEKVNGAPISITRTQEDKPTEDLDYLNGASARLEEESTSCNLQQRRNPSSRFNYLDELDDEEATMASLEKYRPSAYEIGPRGDSDDINDIRDYYSSILTKQRAVQRFTGGQRRLMEDEEDYQPEMNTYDPYEPQQSFRMDGGSYYDNKPSRRPSYGRWPSQPQQQQLEPPKPELDESTQYILNKAKAVRSNPVWEEDRRQTRQGQREEQSRYNFEGDAFEVNDQPLSKPNPTPMMKNPEDTMMNSKTRSLLDKLKESTAALQSMSSGDTEDTFTSPHHHQSEHHNTTRKPSRFLRQESAPEYYPTDHHGREFNPVQSNSNNTMSSVRRIADEVLGESMYPPRDERPLPMRSYDSSYHNNSRRRHSPEPDYTTTYRRQTDEDDLDLMINDLKRKTSGRDMYKVIGNIEGRRITPPPQDGRSLIRDSPSPQRETYRPPKRHEGDRSRHTNGSRRAGFNNPYDPYDHLRGGTGYYEPLRERPREPPRESHHRPRDPPHARSNGHSYEWDRDDVDYERRDRSSGYARNGSNNPAENHSNPNRFSRNYYSCYD